jgi:hypothetical protein
MGDGGWVIGVGGWGLGDGGWGRLVMGVRDRYSSLGFNGGIIKKLLKN